MALASLAGSCARERPPERPAAPETTAVAPPPADTVRFEHVPLGGASDLVLLQQEFGDSGFVKVLKLNRIDLEHARAGDTLIVARPIPSLPDLSPFPRQVDAADSISKLILVSLRVQAWAAYENGRLAHWGPTSTGKKSTPTEPGLYHTNWKAVERTSTVNDTWVLRWYFNIENFSGCSIHEYDLPGYPASHSCIRMLREDAQWIYDWAEQWRLSPDGSRVVEHGTPLVIFGEYDWDRVPPWRRVVEQSDAARLTSDEIEAALRRYLPQTQGPTAAAAGSSDTTSTP